MDQRLSLVTLGVADVAAASAFYERLGWRRHTGSVDEEVSFYQLNGVALGLFSRQALADDAGLPPAEPGLSAGSSLALNFADRGAVDRAFDEAVAAGARPVKRPQEVFWGGYSGYFADPDGHLWELAHNPFWSLDEKGNIDLG